MTDPDDLNRLLKPAQPPPTPGLRDRLRLETTRRLRRGRTMRRLGLAAVLAACYVAGGATIWLTQNQRATGLVPVVLEDTTGTSPVARPPEPPPSPRQLELAAEQADGAESARLFLEAGRRYGGDFNDWTSALRCYRNALDLTREQPVIDPTNDDWLLVKLKTERRESHANP